MPTSIDYYAATPTERAQMLADARREVGRPHLGVYPGPLYEASRVTKRLANRRTPTHRGAPRNA